MDSSDSIESSASMLDISGIIMQPEDHDVLCCRDKTYCSHPGNELFRSEISAWDLAYRLAETKAQKMSITKEIVSLMQMKYRTRFLKPVSGRAGRLWVEVSEQAARDKVGHALRFAAHGSKYGRGKRETSPVDSIVCHPRGRQLAKSDSEPASTALLDATELFERQKRLLDEVKMKCHHHHNSNSRHCRTFDVPSSNTMLQGLNYSSPTSTTISLDTLRHTVLPGACRVSALAGRQLPIAPPFTDTPEIDRDGYAKHDAE